MSALLHATGLTAFYGDAQALFGIDFELHAGETVAIIGANGAGKSTFLKSLTGLVRARPEHIRFDGASIGGLPPGDIVKRGIALVPEGRRLFPSLSVEENLLMGAFAQRPGPWSLPRLFKLFPILEQKRAQPGTSLSGGQQQMVAIGRAMLGRPKLLLLDEPSLGLAPLIVKQVFEVIQRINQSGTTVLLAEQNAYSALAIAHRAYVIERGHITLEGDRDSLLHNEAVRAAYIGA
jgi:branched-chain amino acid transport system ATP-binding protein